MPSRQLIPPISPPVSRNGGEASAQRREIAIGARELQVAGGNNARTWAKIICGLLASYTHARVISLGGWTNGAGQVIFEANGRQFSVVVREAPPE